MINTTINSDWTPFEEFGAYFRVEGGTLMEAPMLVNGERDTEAEGEVETCIESAKNDFLEKINNKFGTSFSYGDFDSPFSMVSDYNFEQHTEKGDKLYREYKNAFYIDSEGAENIGNGYNTTDEYKWDKENKLLWIMIDGNTEPMLYDPQTEILYTSDSWENTLQMYLGKYDYYANIGGIND